MKIHNHIENKVLTDYFFIEGTIDVDEKYFVNKIKEGFEQENNMNFKTNVRDYMTPYEYFNKDEKFGVIITDFINYIDARFDLDKYRLIESWGYCVRTGNQTKFHNHGRNLWSGVVYLNEHPQVLEFPDIKKEVKPRKGRFALFSSFLEHGTKRHESKKTKWGISFNIK
tara:strand:+ start:783 stop:1289 length:507 start_codon:yes stop_codon:yes gene_type:complete